MLPSTSTLRQHGRASRAGRRLPWAMWLLAAMLAAVQTLGVVHRSAHLHGGQAAMLLRAAGQLPAAEQAAPGDEVATVFARLFGHDDDSAGHCQLYDQLAHADLHCGAAVDFAVERVAQVPVARPIALGTSRTTLPFHARGPPSIL